MLGVFLCFWLSTAASGVTPGISFRGFAVTEGESPRTLVTQVQLDYQLTQYLRDGLLNGMTLENAVTFGLEWHQTWWWLSLIHI